MKDFPFSIFHFSFSIGHSDWYLALKTIIQSRPKRIREGELKNGKWKMENGKSVS